MIRMIAPGGLTSTFTGSVTNGSTDGQGVNATFFNPIGLAFDTNDNLFVADFNNNMIRKIKTGGLVSTFAGSTTSGSTNGHGTSARFNNPSFLAFDSSGNLYVSDSGNNAIRKINSSGLVTTYVGSGSQGSSNAPGAATFYRPFGLVFDSNDFLFVSDFNNNMIRKISYVGPASDLSWISTIPATSVMAGDFLPEPPVILLSDLYGGPVIGASISLDLYYDSECTITAGTLGLTGKTASTNSSGFASFSAFNVTTSGSYYVMAFYRSLNSSCSTQALNIAASSLFMLSFSTQPSGSVSLDSFFFMQPVVFAQDSFGNGVSASVTLSAYTDSSCLSAGSGTLSNGTTSTDSFGYAAFSGVSYDQIETIYLKAFSESFSTECSTLNVFVFSCTPKTTASPLYVSTFAGSGIQSDMDGFGIAAAFNRPYGIAASNNGVLYVSDQYSNTIRKIDASGEVSTLAGSGIASFSDGQGTSASFYYPLGLVLDSFGNIIVADSYNNRIRNVTPSGMVITIAGSGNCQGTDASALSASFCYPAGVAIDWSGNIYVADSSNHRIRKISRSRIVSTLAGTGYASYLDGPGNLAYFYYPTGIAVDSAGYVYVSESYSGNNAIRKISPLGYVSTFAGGSYGSYDGQGTSASFYNPSQLFITPRGYIYVADTWNNRIRIITPCFLVSTVSGSASGFAEGIAQRSYFHYPSGVAVDSNGTIWVTDSINNRIRSIGLPQSTTTLSVSITTTTTTSCTASSQPTSLATQVSTFAGSGLPSELDGLGVDAGFVYPSGIAVSSDGVLYVSDQNGDTIRKVDASGLVSTFAGSSYSSYKDGQGTSAYFSNPIGLTIDYYGNVLVADAGNNRIRNITPSGLVTTLAGAGNCLLIEGEALTATFCSPSGIAVDSFGTIYVADSGNHRIRAISSSGIVSTFAGTGYAGYANGPGTSAYFYSPLGVAVDSSGNVYVSEPYYGNNMIRKISPAGYVSTFAGGSYGSADGQGVYASFYNPGLISADSRGYIYVADTWNNRIRIITPCGLVSTIAGSSNGYAEGSGQRSYFRYPSGVAVDANGTIWVADSNNNRIRSISISQTTALSSSGTVTATRTTSTSCTTTSQPTALVTRVSTFAGSGLSGTINGLGASAAFYNPSAIAVSSNGVLYVSDQYSNIIRKIDPSGLVSTLAGYGYSGYQDGQGPYAYFYYPRGLAVDPFGNIIVADSSNNRIRNITPSGMVTTIAGSGNCLLSEGHGLLASFCTPYGVAVDSSGTVYVADNGNHRIRIISTSKLVSTFAGTGYAGYADGPGTSAYFNSPTGIAVDSAGYLYVSESGNYRIRKISPAGIVSTLAGSGSLGSVDGQGSLASFGGSGQLAVDSGGYIYVPDSSTGRIRIITPCGRVSTLAGSSSGYADSLGLKTYFSSPAGLAVDSNGTIWVADSGNNRIRMITFSSSTPSPTVTSTSTTACTTSPQSAPLTTRVATFAGSGAGIDIDGRGTDAAFDYPSGIAVSSAGIIYVSDQYNGTIRMIDSTGQVSTLAGSGNYGYLNGQGSYAYFYYPLGLAIDSFGNILVADYYNYRIRSVTPSGMVTNFAGSGSCRLVEGQGSSASFCYPSGVAVDSSGTIYVADSGNHRIRKITSGGLVSTFAGTGYAGYADGPGTSAFFYSPTGIAVDTSGNVYVSETGNNLVRKISPAGYVSTLAGSGSTGSLDAQGSLATFSSIGHLAVDARGYVYVADSGNNRIRIITPCGLVKTLAGAGYGYADGSGQTARFYLPIDVAVDTSGTIWVTDAYNYRIRNITVT